MDSHVTSDAMRRNPVSSGWLASVVAGAALISAQTVPPDPGAAPSSHSTKNEDAVILSPFQVTASTDMGYEATETLSGTRLKTECTLSEADPARVSRKRVHLL